MYLDFFEKAYYINLDNRQDRKETFEQRCKEVHLPVERFSAISISYEVPDLYEGHNDKKRKEKVSCTLSHQEIVKMAKKNGLNNVLIFEDDCIFLDCYQEYLKLCIEELKDIEWDIFYMGGEPNYYCKEVTEHLVEINGGVFCNHAYAVNKTFYDKFIELDALHGEVIDSLLINYSPSLRKYILPKELLVIQDDNSKSDLWLQKGNTKKMMIDGWNKYVKNI